MNKYSFSVVTVIFNPERSALEETIQSVLAQSFSDWELIIKDAGSDNDVLKFIPDDPRIQVVRKPDSGIYDAMNQAVSYCAGEFVCFLNAGDSFINDQVLSIVSEKRDGLVNFIYGFIYNSSFGCEVRYPDKLSSFFMFRATICHQAQFISLLLLREMGGYDTRFKFRADGELYLRANRLGVLRPLRISRVLVGYDGGGVSASLSNRAELKMEREVILSENFSKHVLLFFKFVHSLTLVDVRRKIKSSGRCDVAKLLVDKINHVFSR